MNKTVTILGATGSVVLFYVVSQIAVAPDNRRGVLTLPSLMGLGIGLAVNNSRAVISGLLHRGGIFERTPKYRIESDADSWHHKKYKVARDLSVTIERILAIYSIICFVAAWKLEMWLSIPFLYLFVQGCTYMALLSLVPETTKAAQVDAAEPLGLPAVAD